MPMTDRWQVQVHAPFPACPSLLIGQVAARSPEFEPSAAGGGAPVLIGSAAGESRESVTVRARGELAERVSNVLAGRIAESHATITSSFTRLRRTALDPAAWPGGAPEMRTVPMLWVRGESLVTGEEVLVPASAAFLHHRPPPGCVSAFRTGSTGVAAHTTAGAAGRHALLEVLERDLVYRAWYGDGPTCAPPLPTPRRLLDRLGLGASVLVLPGPGVRCVVACLHSPDRRAQSFGLRCTLDEPAGAVLPAVYEALMVRARMGTPVARAAWQRVRERSPRLPQDVAERAALTYYGADHLGYWQGRAVPELPRPPAPGTGPAHVLADRTGQDVVAVDTTIPQLDATGLRVVRIVAPGAHQLPGREPAGLSHPPHPIS
jgi:ribosomal protein S12 methylthiotransferase accessory factor